MNTQTNQNQTFPCSIYTYKKYIKEYCVSHNIPIARLEKSKAAYIDIQKNPKLQHKTAGIIVYINATDKFMYSRLFVPFATTLAKFIGNIHFYLAFKNLPIIKEENQSC